MIKRISRRYFEVWGSEEAQNVFLKGILMGLAVLFLGQSVMLTFLAFRKPVLVAVSATESKILTVLPPKEELLKSEIRRVVWKYAEAHYTWTHGTIEKSMESSSKYVSEKFVKQFNAANSAQVKLAKEKKIDEVVYLSKEIELNLPAKIARVPLDRIFMVDGIRATSPVILDVGFDFGARTFENPEGVYIVSEALVSGSAESEGK